MTGMSPMREDERSIRIARWEFHYLVLEAFLIVGCLSALLGMARRGGAALSNSFVLAAVTLLVPLALIPIISISARVYHDTRIRGGWTMLWLLIAAAAAAAIVLFVHW